MIPPTSQASTTLSTTQPAHHDIDRHLDPADLHLRLDDSGYWNTTAGYDSTKNTSGWYNITTKVIDSAGHINYSVNTLSTSTTPHCECLHLLPANNAVVNNTLRVNVSATPQVESTTQHHNLHSSRRFGRIPERDPVQRLRQPDNNWSNTTFDTTPCLTAGTTSLPGRTIR